VFSKISLFYRTVIFLKPIQVFFQFWYRIKSGFIKLGHYNEYHNSKLNVIEINIAKQLYSSKVKVESGNKFEFLNLNYQFEETGVNWDFNGLGKLWNYNLQYFDYLNDETLSDEIKTALIEDCAIWLSENKLPLEPYPVSLRIVNWIIYYSKTRYSSVLFENTLKKQISYLKHNLEYHIQANHLLENYIALCFGGLVIEETLLIDFAFKKVEKELDKQILPDGAHYECSPMYHCIIFGKLLLLLDVLKNRPVKKLNTKILEEKLSLMLGWLNSYSFKSDSLANFNDSTYGIAPDVLQIRNVCEKLRIIPAEINLGESGYRKRSVANFEILVDVGNIIPTYQPGHAHSDMLSFCLNFKEQNIIIDKGISTYQPGVNRELERSTVSHNTVTVNNVNQSEVWGSFRVGKRANLKLEVDKDNELAASHNGYFNSFGKHHKRTFQFNENAIIINDELIGNTELKTNNIARFYFDWKVKLKKGSNNFEYTANDEIVFKFLGASFVEVVNFDQPMAYNLFKSSQLIQVKFISNLTTTITPF
jgi:uncharacterized heparinase superfamily protein